METARGRAQRRHVREKATINHLVRDVYEPKTPDEKQAERRPTTSTGLPIEDQVRKEWKAALARNPRFFGDKRQITSVTELPMPEMPSPPRLRKRPFEATAATSAADEIDIAGCAAKEQERREAADRNTDDREEHGIRQMEPLRGRLDQAGKDQKPGNDQGGACNAGQMPVS
jgi:hypothetical protein